MSENPPNTLTSSQQVKIVVIGDGSIGKTCLLTVFVEKSFPVDYIPTVFNTMEYKMKIEGVDVDAQLWDTAGQEEFERIRVLSYENTTCFLVCFSVADLVTFQNIKQKWLPELRRNNPDSKVLLVGLKCDLRKSKEERKASTGSGSIERDKEVSEKRIRQLVKESKFDGYIECSALKGGDKLEEVFHTAGRLSLVKLGKLEPLPEPVPDSSVCRCS